MRRALAVASGALLLLAAATPASAASPERSGWWNRLSSGALLLPAPTTAPGDLRVASGGDAPTAYAAVLLRAAGSTSATLELVVREGRAVGTPDVVACPTVEDDWPAGDDQAFELAPAYDCGLGQAVGSPTADGTGLVFLLDGTTQTAPGQWSLALVPAPEVAAPFVVDLQPPGPQSFLPAPPDPAADPDPGPAAPPTDPTAAKPFDGAAPEPLLPGLEPGPAVPATDLGVAQAPLLAGELPPVGAGTVPATVPGPALAGAAPAGPLRTFATRPVAVAVPGLEGDRLLALLLLVGLSGTVGYAAGKNRTAPQLIGGRAGRAVVATGPVSGDAEDAPRQRGIGRFAKQRERAPRRLR